MSEDAGVIAVWCGIIVLAAWWGRDPAYIDNVIADEKSEYGEPYILYKLGSGQVAVFHGFVDDYSVCDMARIRIEAEGGVYVCSPSSDAVSIKPWWKFW